MHFKMPMMQNVTLVTNLVAAVTGIKMTPTEIISLVADGLICHRKYNLSLVIS